MKKFIFSLLVLCALQSSAQIGVVTISPDDYVPVEQWYQVEGQEFKDLITLYSSEEYCINLINEMLEDYGSTFADGELLEDGNILWELDHVNGFFSHVYFFLADDGAYIEIYSAKYDEQ